MSRTRVSVSNSCACRSVSVGALAKWGFAPGKMKAIYDNIFKQSWVVSWSSAAQLDVLALMSCKLQWDHRYDQRSFMAIDFDEADDTVKSVGRISRTEKQLDGILQFDRVSV